MKDKIKKGILKGINLFGYHINYKIYKIRPNGNLTATKKVKRPLYVEFLGVRGVGKSTVLLELMRSNNRFVDFDLFSKHYSLYSRELTRGVEGNTFYQQVVNDQIKKMYEEDAALPTDKAMIIGTFYERAHRDLQLKRYNKQYIVLSDEGFFKHFYESIGELYTNAEGEEILRKQCEGCAYVHCYNSPEKIVSQIAQRGATRLLNVIYRNRTPEEWKNIVIESYKKEDKLLNFMAGLGIPVLRINTSEDIQNNANRVSEFINDLQNR